MAQKAGCCTARGIQVLTGTAGYQQQGNQTEQCAVKIKGKKRTTKGGKRRKNAETGAVFAEKKATRGRL